MLQTGVIAASRMIFVIALTSLASDPGAGASDPGAGASPPHLFSAPGVVTGRVPTAGSARPVAHARVRLRDPRLGPTVAETRTNGLGDFSFTGVERGSYVAELLSESGDVIAASQVISIEAGQTVTTTLPLVSELAGGVIATSGAIVSAGAATTALSAATTVASLFFQPVGPPVSGEK